VLHILIGINISDYFLLVICYYLSTDFARVRFVGRRLCGVVVSVLATVPKGYGFKTRPRRWIFKGDKKSAALLPLGWEVKREGPML
jgi:hypothetical protein